MKRLISLTLLLAVIGCSGPAPTPAPAPPAPAPTLQSEAAKFDAAAPDTCTVYLGTPVETKMLVISDKNYKQFVGDGKSIVTADGKTRMFGHVPRQPGKLMLRQASAVLNLIPRNQWSTLIKQKGTNTIGGLQKQLGRHSLDQNGLNFCWAYATTRVSMIMRDIQGDPFVLLSPESIAGPITGWRNVGGNWSDASAQFQKVGACPASFMPSGVDDHSLSPSRWKSGWQAACADYKMNQWYDTGNFDEEATCLLMGFPVSVGLDWWGHEVTLVDLVEISPGNFGAVMINSWGDDWPSTGAMGYSVLTEAKATSSDAGCPMAMVCLAVLHDKGLLKPDSDEVKTIVALKKAGKLKRLPKLGSGSDESHYQLVP